MEPLYNITPPISYTTLLILGAVLRLFVGMRRFNRRGLGGLQHFNNYFIALITLFVEWVLKMIGTGLILWGLLGILFV